MTPNPQKENRVAAVRRFNRFYTREIGVLREAYLGSPFSLTEGRVLYELAHPKNPADKATASTVCAALDLDPGYLSRIIRSFRKSRLVRTEGSPSDGRETLLSLTPRGRQAIASLNSRSNKEVAARLRPIPESEKSRLVSAMHTIETLLAPPASDAQTEPYLLRPHHVGDMGWITHRQGLLYAQEYGWDERYEALAAKIVGQFIDNFDPRKERCWIAERRGEIVGSVFLVKHSRITAKLRLLYVEPSARGLGIGQRLVSECVRFARQAGYKTLTLWTQSNLYAARRIYKSQGFRVTAKKRHQSFGHHLVAETWDLKL